MMNFGQALEAMNGGGRVARKGWNGKGMWLRLIEFYQLDGNPYTLGLKLLPWIGMKTADGAFVPWLASQTDMQAEDWEVVK
jgi:hypothetical protein